MELNRELEGMLPPHIAPDAIVLLDKINGAKPPQNREQLAKAASAFLKTTYSRSLLTKELCRLGFNTKEELLLAVDVYIELRTQYPDLSFYEKGTPSGGTGVTDTALLLIDNVVKKGCITDRFDIMSEVCTALESRFGDGDRLEARLSKMNLRTTQDILHAIDLYFVMCKLFPGIAFGRSHMRDAWNKVV